MYVVLHGKNTKFPRSYALASDSPNLHFLLENQVMGAVSTMNHKCRLWGRQAEASIWNLRIMSQLCNISVVSENTFCLLLCTSWEFVQLESELAVSDTVI